VFSTKRSGSRSGLADGRTFILSLHALAGIRKDRENERGFGVAEVGSERVDPCGCRNVLPANAFNPRAIAMSKVLTVCNRDCKAGTPVASYWNNNS